MVSGRVVAGIVVVLLVVSQLVMVSGLAASGVGYLAIKDYLGKIWSMDDVRKMIDYHYLTADGKNVSLADYFWVVVDGDYKNGKYNLRDFIRSPLDNRTAVLPLSAGDHTVDIYWFGYHQRQLVHIVAGQTYVLNLETAPVAPFKTAGKPPSSAEWDLAYNPKGLTISRRDGNAWVRFDYDQPIIDVAWYDTSTGWNYQSLTVNIDTQYQYKFHIKDPNHPEYYEEKTGSFLWLSWDVYKVKEEVKWNRTGQILHVSYIVAIAENEKLLSAANKVWYDVGCSLIYNVLGQGNIIDRVTGTIENLKAFIDYTQTAYDTYMGEFFSKNYQKTVILIWDVFVTPTQIVITATAYDIENGKPVIKSITSNTAFVIDDRLVYIKQLAGGIQHVFIDMNKYSVSSSWAANTHVSSAFTIKGGNRIQANGTTIYLPGMNYYVYNVDDLSKYIPCQWIMISLALTVKNSGTGTYESYSYKLYVSLELIVTMDNTSKANLYEQRLKTNGISYTRNGNTFTFSNEEKFSGTIYVHSGTPDVKKYNIVYISDYEKIMNLVPTNTSAQIIMGIIGHIDIDTDTAEHIILSVSNIHIMYSVIPKMIPPQISLLKDGFQRVNGAFAVQVYSTLFKDDSNNYLLGYYLLGNEPPPTYIIRDVHYDLEHNAVDYVWTIISADCYGQDIVDMKRNTTLDSNNETIYNYYLRIKPTVKTFDNVTLALFDLNRMAFLNLAPNTIEYLIAVPPNGGGYGVPIIDWSKVSVATVNFTRSYVLYYYYDKQDGEWVKAKPVYHNDTRTYDIVQYADNSLIEKLPPGNLSRYYYKLVYNDTNETLKGWLWNNNGTLKIITGDVTWSLTPQELQKILKQIQLQGIFDKWAKQWSDIAAKLGLLASMAGQINGLLDWFMRNKLLILGGFLGLIVLLMLVAAAARPRIVVSTGIRR